MLTYTWPAGDLCHDDELPTSMSAYDAGESTSCSTPSAQRAFLWGQMELSRTTKAHVLIYQITTREGQSNIAPWLERPQSQKESQDY